MFRFEPESRKLYSSNEKNGDKKMRKNPQGFEDIFKNSFASSIFSPTYLSFLKADQGITYPAPHHSVPSQLIQDLPKEKRIPTH